MLQAPHALRIVANYVLKIKVIVSGTKVRNGQFHNGRRLLEGSSGVSV